MNQINVYSEIAPLKKVMLHRPGEELLLLTPSVLEELLFDDIPDLPKAQKEHDQFAQILKDNGVEVLYLEDLMAETLDANSNLKLKFIEQYLCEGEVVDSICIQVLTKYLLSINDNKTLVLKTMAGIKLDELPKEDKELLEKSKVVIQPIFVKPMPNLYFTRDPFASVGNKVVINKMYAKTRNRETIYADYIFKYHPIYKQTEIVYGRDNKFHIEGGDILNLSENTLAIGISQRSEIAAIEKLAKNLFFETDSKITKILTFLIPNTRAFMHLDTVFTQIDYDAFTYHPGILDQLEVLELSASIADKTLQYQKVNGTLQEILSKYLNRNVRLFPCGAGDCIAAEREQWNDGSNTLCIAPGKIIVYKRNRVTNAYLKENGFEVLELDADNLCVGRGGPRCMSMPLIRK